MEYTLPNNAAQKMGKLSIYSSESCVSIESPGYEGRSSMSLFIEELEGINRMIRSALEVRGKVVESVGNAQGDLRVLARVICDEVVSSKEEFKGSSEKWEKEVVELGKYTQGWDSWRKIWVNSGSGFYLTGKECREACAMVVGLIRDSGREEIEDRVRVLEEKLVDAKLCIKKLREVLREKNKEILGLVDEVRRNEGVVAVRDLNAARYIDSETTNYEDY